MLKREIIATIVISGHGGEDHLDPFDRDSDIGQFYRNNVVVYSTSAIPDIAAIMNARDANRIITNISDKLKTAPHSDTRRIVNEFKHELRPEYQELVLQNRHLDKSGRSAEPRYLNEASKATTYLANKKYFFYNNVDANDNTLGMSVVDLREKQTHADGSISYNQVRLPNKVNLMYKDKVEEFAEVLENELGIGGDVRLESIYSALGFDDDDSTNKLENITLVELYAFFKLLQIDYVNIFDLTCRNCRTRRLEFQEIEEIARAELEAFENVKAFGKTKRRRRNKKKKKVKKSTKRRKK